MEEKDQSFDNVIILGAGASVPYGFTTGLALIDSVLESCLRFAEFWKRSNSRNPPVYRSNPYFDLLLEDQKSKRYDFNKFYTELNTKAWDSIDDFLNKYPDFGEFGKRLIAYSMILKENSNLLHHPTEDDWFRYLWSYGKEKLRNDNPNVAFITFNYERSLEHPFYLMFKSWDKGHEKSRLDKIPIMHVYGHLGDIFKYPFGAYPGDISTLTREVYEYINSNLKTIYEVKAATTEHDEARKIIGNAKSLYITGFGFNPTNVDLIFSKGFSANHIYVNSYDGYEKEEQDIRLLLRKYYDKTKLGSFRVLYPKKEKLNLKLSNKNFMREFLRI